MIYYKLYNYNGDQSMITKPVKKKPLPQGGYPPRLCTSEEEETQMKWKKTTYIPHPDVDAKAVLAIMFKDADTGDMVALIRDPSRKDLDPLFATLLMLLRETQPAFPNREYFTGVVDGKAHKTACKRHGKRRGK